RHVATASIVRRRRASRRLASTLIRADGRRRAVVDGAAGRLARTVDVAAVRRALLRIVRAGKRRAAPAVFAGARRLGARPARTVARSIEANAVGAEAALALVAARTRFERAARRDLVLRARAGAVARAVEVAESSRIRACVLRIGADGDGAARAV